MYSLSSSSESTSSHDSSVLSWRKWGLDTLIILLLLLMAILINLRMIRYGLNGLGDLRWHLTWIQHFAHQLAQGIPYPRWLAGTNFGYGSPTFVFYPPLVYYIGSILKLIGFNIEQTATITFTLPIFLSGLCFYIYGRHKWGKIPSLIGSLFYMNTPWIFGYVIGGGLPSLYVFAWLPLGVYLTDRAMSEGKWRVCLSFFWAMVALTHTPTLLIYAIAGLVYMLSFFWRKPAKAVILTLISAGLGLGMASFYILPAIWEQGFTNIDYAIRFFGDTPGYFISLQELLKAKFSSAYVQQLALIVLFLSISLFCWRKNWIKSKESLLWLIPIGIVFFLRGNWVASIWESISILQKLQRPARIDMFIYLGVAALSALAMSGVLQLRRFGQLFFSTLFIIIIFFNFQSGYKNSLKPPTLHSPGQGKVFIREWLETILYDPYSDKLIDVPEYRPKLATQSTPSPFQGEKYTDAGLPKKDYTLSAWADSPLPIPNIGEPKVSVITGKADIKIDEWGSYQRNLTINVQEPAQIRIRTYYYPAWKLWVNGRSHALEMLEDGTLSVNLDPGEYQLRLSYGWTQPLAMGVLLSLSSLLIVLGYGFMLLFVLKKHEKTASSHLLSEG